MAESELILLHHGYGTAIRNRWIHGKRDPAIVQFFLAHKIAHPDDMSMILIKALWLDLNSRLTPEQRASIEKKRRIVARKRSAYESSRRNARHDSKRHRRISSGIIRSTR
jgi:hypothetical protein